MPPNCAGKGALKATAVKQSSISAAGEISNTDVNAWTQLLGGVVQERNLEKLDLLLKFFYRTVQRSGSKKWEDTYMKVINVVQTEVLQAFGHFMKLQIF